ncbi:MAG: GNAT family N-acetyltransferase [Lachnospiraceae bacterium]|nr:GNAT family N-acetyltransferase [Lachnospiraceae bacterium]
MLELKKFNTDLEKEWAFVRDMPENENGLTNSYNGVSKQEFEEKILPEMLKHERGEDLPEWMVPETMLYLWKENEIVGQFRIRHYLTDALKNGSGHIGYFIAKEYRNKGYGTEGLKQTLQIARQIVPEDEIYLRVNKDNPASLKVMQKNGGKVVGDDEGHFFVRIPKKVECSEDCCIEQDNYWFRYRTGAIIVRDGKMLFVKSMYGGYYYTIGGGVHLGEDSRSCIEREVFEETGVKCTANRIAITCENLFVGVGGPLEGRECHVLEYYYIMDAPEDASFKAVNDEGEKLEWIPIDEFQNADIRPRFLKRELKGVIEGGPLIHVINDERKNSI